MQGGGRRRREHRWLGVVVLVLLALPGAGPALAGTPDPQLDTTFGAGARFFDIRGTGDISGDILTLPDLSLIHI